MPLTSRCVHNSTCRDGINEYHCLCHDGYEGGDCEVDVSECAAVPCQHGGMCFEKSNASLYHAGADLPEEVRFTRSLLPREID